MAHQPLKKIFHMTRSGGEAAVEAEWQQRRDNPATVTWPYFVGEWETFAVNTVDLVGLQNQAWRNELRVFDLWRSLPRVAQLQYTHSLIIDEIRSTNEIEGIHSTRQEVNAALAAAHRVLDRNSENAQERKRFVEMAASYLVLFDPSMLGEDHKFPQALADMRSLYDQLLLSSLEKEDYPDGEYFRKGPVVIADGTKTVHTGIIGEKDIKARMRAMLESQSPDRTLPLVDAFVGHFMLEHTHPFYDGNGRFSRLLLAIRLREVLSAPSALSLSAEIMRSKDRYYKAFVDAEHPLNRAELTHFVAAMLKILLRAQGQLIESLDEKLVDLVHLNEAIQALPISGTKDQALFSEYQIKILHLLGQAALFHPLGILKHHEIADLIERSPSTIRPELRKLEKADLIEATSKRPLAFRLSEKGKDRLGLS